MSTSANTHSHRCTCASCTISRKPLKEGEVRTFQGFDPGAPDSVELELHRVCREPSLGLCLTTCRLERMGFGGCPVTPDVRLPVKEIKDAVVMPGHYARFKIEPIYFIQENNLNPLQGKVVKYVVRYPFKNGIEDLKKAQRCIEMLIAKESGNPDWWKKPEEKSSAT